MIVQCPECRTKFKLADEKVTPKGVKIRCSSCKHIFVVRKEAEQAPPAPPPQSAGKSDFSVDDFGTGVDSSDVFSDTEFTDGPLGQTRPPAEGGEAARPDRPVRPPAGKAPPPRPPVKPDAQDNVFNIDDVDFSAGRKMEVDLSESEASAPAPETQVAPTAPAAPPSAPDPFGDNKGEFDNLDELFGPKKGEEQAAQPPAAPPASPPPQQAPPQKGQTDPFGDSMTLDTAAQPGAGAPQSAGGGGDPFGDLFDGGDGGQAAPPPVPSQPVPPPEDEEPSIDSLLTNDAETGEDMNSGLRTGAEPAIDTGEGFDSLISGTDDFFGAGNAEGESFQEGGETPRESSDSGEPTLHWGNQKKVQNVAPPSVLPKIIGGMVFLLLLVVGWRASVEYAPDLYFDAGMDYDEVVALRGIIPFPQNPDFPPPPKSWELSLDKRFTIVNQFSKELYVVEGSVKNVSPRVRSFIKLRGQALSAANQKIGLPETVYAGNVLDVEALKRLPIPKVREKLQLKLGSGGSNFEVQPGSSVAFMMVFPELPEKASNVKILEVKSDVAGQ